MRTSLRKFTQSRAQKKKKKPGWFPGTYCLSNWILKCNSVILIQKSSFIKGRTDFGLFLWKYYPGDFNFVFCKMGWISPSLGVVMMRGTTAVNCQSVPGCSLWPFLFPALLASLVFIFRSANPCSNFSFSTSSRTNGGQMPRTHMQVWPGVCLLLSPNRVQH